jgi:hypothetical protein
MKIAFGLEIRESESMGATRLTPLRYSVGGNEN